MSGFRGGRVPEMQADRIQKELDRLTEEAGRQQVAMIREAIIDKFCELIKADPVHTGIIADFLISAAATDQGYEWYAKEPALYGCMSALRTAAIEAREYFRTHKAHIVQDDFKSEETENGFKYSFNPRVAGWYTDEEYEKLMCGGAKEKPLEADDE